MEYAVKLKIYRGTKTYNRQGELTSPSQNIDLSPYNSFEWNNWMNHARKLGYSDAEVLTVSEIVKTKVQNENEKAGEMREITSYKEVSKDADIIAEIETAVKKAFSDEVIVEMTPQEKRIAELEARLDAMSKGKQKEPKAPKDEKPAENESDEADPTLEELQAEYERLTEKSPDGKWKERRLTEEINKLKS